MKENSNIFNNSINQNHLASAKQNQLHFNYSSNNNKQAGKSNSVADT